MCSASGSGGIVKRAVEQIRLKQRGDNEAARMKAQTELRSQPMKKRGAGVTGLQIRG